MDALFEQHAEHARAEVDERPDGDERVVLIVAGGAKEPPDILDAVRLGRIEPKPHDVGVTLALGGLELKEDTEGGGDHAVAELELHPHIIARAIDDAGAARTREHLRQGRQVIEDIEDAARLGSHQGVGDAAHIALPLAFDLQPLLHPAAGEECLMLFGGQSTG